MSGLNGTNAVLAINNSLHAGHGGPHGATGKEADADTGKLHVMVEQPKSGPAAPPPKQHPHAERTLGGFLMSTNFILALQLLVGMFTISLFTFVNALHYPASCVAATLFLVVSVKMSPMLHIGTRINAFVSAIGPAFLGVLLGGLVATAAKLAGPPTSWEHTLVLALLSSALMAMLSIVRVATQPPTLWALGMMSCLTLGLTVVSSFNTTSPAQLWGSVVVYVLASAVLAATVAVAVASLVLPSLASDEVITVTSTVLRTAGTTTSRCSTLLFRPPQHAAIGPPRLDVHEVRVQEVADGLLLPLEVGDEEEFTALVEVMTRPPPAGPPPSAGPPRGAGPPKDAPSAPRCPPPAPPIASVRPLIAKARMALAFASVEPPWLRRAPFDAASWGSLLAAVDLLVTRLSALESVLESGEVLNEASTGAGRFAGPLRLVFSQASTALAHLAATLEEKNAPSQANFCSALVLFGRSWLDARTELRASIAVDMQHHWDAVRNHDKDHPYMVPRATQIRTLMFTWTLASGVIEAIEKLERTAAAAVCGPYATGAGAAADGADGLAPRAAAWFKRNVASWTAPLLPTLFNTLLLNTIWATLTGLPVALKTPASRSQLLGSRLFQAGFKYWLALTLVLVGTLLAMTLSADARRLAPSFGFVAATLSMSERVEATLTKVVSWVLGAALGGALGYVAMIHPALASNPYGLMAVTCSFTFLVGLLDRSEYKETVVLTLMAYTPVVMCQYSGVSGATGSAEYFYSRTLAIICGCVVAALISNLILPWYASSYALEAMAGAFKRSSSFMSASMDQLYADGIKSLRAWMAQRSTEYEAARGSQGGAGPGGRGCTCVAWREVREEQMRQLEAALELSRAAAAASGPSSAPPRGAGDGGGGGPPGVTHPALLQGLVAGPLTMVQMLLAKETVAWPAPWQRGLLGMPPVVGRVLRSMTALLDRLAALQLMLLGGPLVTGRFTGAQLELQLAALHDTWRRVSEQVAALADKAATHMVAPTCATRQALEEQVSSLQAARSAMRKRSEEVRGDLFVRVAEAPDACVEYLTNIDDSIRALSFTHAYIQAVNKATAVARTVLAQDCQGRGTVRAWLK